jgi:hypothetical protein
MAIIRPLPESYYYSGQGRLGIGERNPLTGVLSNVEFIGNVTSLQIDIAVTKFEHKESMSGDRAIDKTTIKEKNATFKFSSESLKVSLMALGLYGSSMAVEPGTVVGEQHMARNGLAIPLKFPNVSNVVLKKNGTAVPAAEWDYDDGFGTIYIKADSAAIGATDVAVTVDYSYGANTTIEAFTQATPPERFLRFEGLNTVDGSLRLIDIPRSALDPLTGLEMINEEFGAGEFNGNILPDLTVTAAGVSKYFRERRIDPA